MGLAQSGEVQASRAQQRQLLLLAAVWLVLALLVIGYPLGTGRMKVGLDPVSRDRELRHFWTAYAFSTGSFILASLLVALIVHQALPWPAGPPAAASTGPHRGCGSSFSASCSSAAVFLPHA